jgi:negative regulator of replication initiation
MKQKLNNYVGAAVDDELYRWLLVISTHNNESIAETFRKYLRIALKCVYAAIPQDKITAMLLEIDKVKNKKLNNGRKNYTTT